MGNVRILSASFEILWGRLTDFQRLRHVEKSLLVIEHLLNQDAASYSASFETFCRERKRDISKLKEYRFIIDETEIGQNVRMRASSIFDKLWKNEGSVVKPKKRKKKTKKKTKKNGLLRFNSHSTVNAIGSDSESE